MNIHVARQPILDRNQSVYGYELLYRNNTSVNHFQNTQADVASSRVIVDSFHSIGIRKMTGGKKAFVNFSEELIDQEVATLFPSEVLVVEVLESIIPTPSVVTKCKKLRQKGYEIALDDFVFSDEFLPLLEVATIIKLDFLQSTLEEMEDVIKRFKRPGLRFLAEKIENQLMFDYALEMGFSYFQGYFFSKPVIISNQDIRPLAVNYLRLWREVNREEIHFDDISKIVSQDVSLSYKLMRLVNSAGFGFRYQIKTVHSALVALGSTEMRKWISLIAMMGLNEGQPEELLRMSLIRGKYCERLAQLSGKSRDSEVFFMLGLFSLMDTIMKRKFKSILAEISVPDEMHLALEKNEGPMVPYLQMVRCHEKGQWDELDEMAKSLQIDPARVSDIFLDAVNWCNSIFIRT